MSLISIMKISLYLGERDFLIFIAIGSLGGNLNC